MLEIILISVAWRRGWGVWALLPTAAAIAIFVLASLAGENSGFGSPIAWFALAVEYIGLLLMIFAPRGKPNTSVTLARDERV